MAARNAIQGARMTLILNGQEVGWATGVNLRRPHQNFAVEVLGDADPQEIVPVGRRYMLDCQTVQIYGEALEASGLFADTTADLITQPAFSAQLFDQVGDVVMYEAEGLRLSDNTIQLGARDVARENVSFEGTRIRRVTPAT